MGFFKNLKQRTRMKMAPVAPVQPMPMRKPEALPPKMGPRSKGLPSLNYGTLDRPRIEMAIGGPLIGRAAKISSKVLDDVPYQGMIGTKAGLGSGKFSVGKGRPGSLASQARNLNMIRRTEDAILGTGILGGATLADATQMFSEPASIDNISFMSPEAMGTDLANLKVGIDNVIDLARNKANEMGADINEYVERTRSAYNQQMERQRLLELDAEQGLKPFSLLLGPDMPLTRPEETDPRVDRMIESGMGSSESIDDILSDLEKKN